LSLQFRRFRRRAGLLGKLDGGRAPTDACHWLLMHAIALFNEHHHPIQRG
jgi:hypothetical protein